MNVWSSIATKFHDHLTPSGRRESKPERAERKRHAKARARQMRGQVDRSAPTFPWQ
jgi:hypothetical protein